MPMVWESTKSIRAGVSPPKTTSGVEGGSPPKITLWAGWITPPMRVLILRDRKIRPVNGNDGKGRVSKVDAYGVRLEAVCF